MQVSSQSFQQKVCIEMYNSSDISPLAVQDNDSILKTFFVSDSDTRVSVLKTIKEGISCNIARTSFDIKPLADCTYEEIQKIVSAGVAKFAWSLGDRYPVTINSQLSASLNINGTFYFYIIGFNHNAEIEGDNSVTFQLAQSENFTNIAFFQAPMNQTDVTTGGWASSYMRNTILVRLFNALPAELQNIISTTNKYTDNVGGGSTSTNNVTVSEDKLFLLSEYEILGRRIYANTAEQNFQRQYEWYSDNTDLKRYKHNDPTTSWAWWTRSTFASQATRFRSIDSSGNAGSNIATSNYGVAPAFNVR